MNFEVIDNLFQVIVLLLAAIVAVAMAIQQKSRRCLILGFTYACFAMGTLFYLLHLKLTGDIPHVFYVAETAWLAAYLFLLSLQIVRSEQKRIGFSWSALICAIGIGETIRSFHMMASYLLILVFAVTAGAITYITIFRIQTEKRDWLTDFVVQTCVCLQLFVYVYSAFYTDFTKFQLYFAMDIALTLCLALLLPLILREVRDGV